MTDQVMTGEVMTGQVMTGQVKTDQVRAGQVRTDQDSQDRSSWDRSIDRAIKDRFSWNSSKFVWIQNFYEPKIFFNPKSLCTQNFLVPNFLDLIFSSQNFLNSAFFGPKIFLDPKLVGPFIF